MPYQEHRVFEKPKAQTKIWHYITYTKFVSLLSKKALYFVTVEKLSEDDKFEGALPDAVASLFLKARETKIKEFEKFLGPSSQFLNEMKKMKKQPLWNEFFKKHVLVNCWHMNDVESVAMWKLYAKTLLVDEGVAIRSTYERLMNSFRNYTDPVFIGKVNYIDYRKDGFPIDNALYPSVFKRRSFEYEHELRACIFKFPFEGKGENIPVELGELIEKIYVSPTAEDWFKELVESVVNRYDLRKKVCKSDLARDPLY